MKGPRSIYEAIVDHMFDPETGIPDCEKKHEISGEMGFLYTRNWKSIRKYCILATVWKWNIWNISNKENNVSRFPAIVFPSPQRKGKRMTTEFWKTISNVLCCYSILILDRIRVNENGSKNNKYFRQK